MPKVLERKSKDQGMMIPRRPVLKFLLGYINDFPGPHCFSIISASSGTHVIMFPSIKNHIYNINRIMYSLYDQI